MGQHFHTANPNTRDRNCIPQGKELVIQKWVVDVQPEIKQYTDPTTGEVVYKLDSHGQAWSSAIISAAQAAYPGILL